ncbi:MAG: methyl-accepting chemotaxis protein [Nitrospinae bacterium]|nr:methyl-accepting chemotaxis protein [Nitrospinota bacterium]
MTDKKGVTKYSGGATRIEEGRNMEAVGKSRGFSIRTKLLGGFALVALIGAVVAGIGMAGIKSSEKAATGIDEIYIPTIGVLSDVRGLLWRSQVNQLILANPLAMPDMRKTQYNFEDEFNAIETNWKIYDGFKKADDSNDLAESFIEKFGEYKRKSLALIEISKQKDALLDASILPKDAKVVALDEKFWTFYLEVRANHEDMMTYLDGLMALNVAESGNASSIAVANAEKFFIVLTAAAIIGFILALMLGYYLSRSITRPVIAMVEVIRDVAEGDFTREVPITSHDEIGVMGETFNGMVEYLRGMFKEISGSSRTLAASAEKLTAISSQLSASSEQMSQQSVGVASATEQMSSNINSMATAVEEASMNATAVSGTAEQVSANMRSIATSVEEMSQSIREVAKSADETSKVAGDAMGLSKNACDTMQTLGAAANEIGKVTAMIKRIAEQTNLLALNATIEAASAGEAGRGFAVVANEIKELANQSARAAEEIAAKIDGVRGSTTSAVKVISDVSDIIGKINTSVESITGAVNQQTAAANEISRNVSEVSKGAVDIAGSIAEVAKGATEISRNSGEAARGANEVSSNIQGISKAVADNNSGIQQINSSSGELAKMASSMQAMVSRFKVENNGNGHRPPANVVVVGGNY